MPRPQKAKITKKRRAICNFLWGSFATSFFYAPANIISKSRLSFLYTAFLMSSFLSACSVFTASTQKPSALLSQSETVPLPFQLAFCQGDLGTALASISDRARLQDRFLLLAAYSLEAGGHAARALPLYEEITKRTDLSPIHLACGRSVHLHGPVLAVAQERQKAVLQKLAQMDAALDDREKMSQFSSPMPPLHKGLPSQNSPKNQNITPAKHLKLGGNRPDQSAKNPPPLGRAGSAQTTDDQTIANSQADPKAQNSNKNKKPSTQASSPILRPKSLDPLGRWFVHLASYKSQENADAGLKALSLEHPGLDGLFDNWQTQIKTDRIWRLGLRLSSEAEAKAICNAVKEKRLYCAILDTNRS